MCHICRKERPGAVLVFMTGWEDISCLRDQVKAHPLLGDPNRVLLLTCHGSMATSEQVSYKLLSDIFSISIIFSCCCLRFIFNQLLHNHIMISVLSFLAFRFIQVEIYFWLNFLVELHYVSFWLPYCFFCRRLLVGSC